MKSGPLAGAALLDLLESGWRHDLSAGARAADLDVGAEVLQAAARALGAQARAESPIGTARRWPACVVVALARVAGASYRGGDGRAGSWWPAWHRAAGLRASRRSAQEWGEAFVAALATLGIAPAARDAHNAARDAAQGAHNAARDAAQGAHDAAYDMTAVRHAVLAQATSPDPVPPPAADAAARLRLDPFGQGVLLDERPATPQEVVDPADPLLVFDENGERVGRELPAEPVWVLHPADVDLRSDVPPRVVVTSRLPLTWRGWRLRELDLGSLAWVELAGPDRAAAPRRPVRGRSRPGLRTGPAVRGVTAGSGEPVFAKPPAVLLPPGPDRWRVEVRRAGTSAVLSTLTAAGDGWRQERLWQRVARPLLGTVTVTVTSADGEARPGMRRTLTVAEGLSASYFPALRLTAGRGLEAAEAALSAPPGMTVSPQAAPVSAETATVEVTCVAAPVLQRLRVTPPHLRIRIEPEPGSGGTPTRWHHAGPLPLRTADLWHGGALRVDLPGIDRCPPIEVAGRDGRVVQVLEPTRQGRYPLRRMADTATALGGASLLITVEGRTATIARVTAPDGTADPWVNPVR